jgi:hypothetical protein
VPDAPAVRTVTTAPADRVSSGTSASAAATAPEGRATSTVTDATTWSADQQPSTSGGSARGATARDCTSRAYRMRLAAVHGLVDNGDDSLRMRILMSANMVRRGQRAGQTHFWTLDEA